jgi:hypothetical protein
MDQVIQRAAATFKHSVESGLPIVCVGALVVLFVLF